MSLPFLFGANLDPTRGPDDPVARAVRIEELGYDFLTIQDHPYQAAFHDTWTLISYVAARTSRLSLVPTVANLPLRPPAMLAKAANSLDQLSGGRLQLGLGAGAFWDAIAAMGGPRRAPGEAVDALDEALDVIRAMWSGDRAVRVDGSVYGLRGVHPGAAPSPTLGVWLGAYGPRTLALTGAKADGWLPSLGFLPVDRLGAAIERIDRAALAAGRDPATIRKVYNLNGTIRASGGGSGADGPFTGSATRWVEDIAAVAAVGINGVSYWPDRDHDEQLRRFATEIVPQLRSSLPVTPRS
ncbi:MAG: LLM class flavin-dependent oxidoreductase [Acidimicrobiales bacterium]